MGKQRTQDELVARYEARKHADNFGFETDEYLIRMDQEHVMPYLSRNADVSAWEFNEDNLEREMILERMRVYMPFAYSQAENQRGVSASASMMRYVAWIWLSGDDKFSQKMEKELFSNYHSYGIPILDMIIAEYDIDRNAGIA